MPQRRQIAPGAYLSVLEADKFCRQRVSATRPRAWSAGATSARWTA